MTVDAPAGCQVCRIHRGEAPAGPGGVILHEDGWVLEHAIEPFPLLGWLVLKPFRHVEAVADLTVEEAAALGPLLHRVTGAMTELLHPEKIYVNLYAEAAGFAHLHLHLIPRAADTPPERRGPRVFDYLREAVASGQNNGDPAAAAELADWLRELLPPSPHVG